MIVDQQSNEYFVFDDHTHMGVRGNSSLGYSSLTVEQKIADMDACGVDMAVVFPMQAPNTDYRNQNELMLAAQEGYPHRIVAFARLQPFFKEKAVADVREFAQRGVKGLKLHPFMDFGGVPVNSPELLFPIMEEASRHRLTVLIHSGESWNSHPSLIGDLASHFPDVTFIIGHSGLWEYHHQAVLTARQLSNVYLDLAEIAPPGVIPTLVTGAGVERVLYGSDHPFIPFGFELGKVAKYAGLQPEQLALILGRNTARVLGVTPNLEGRTRVALSAL